MERKWLWKSASLQGTSFQNFLFKQTLDQILIFISSFSILILCMSQSAHKKVSFIIIIIIIIIVIVHLLSLSWIGWHFRINIETFVACSCPAFSSEVFSCVSCQCFRYIGLKVSADSFASVQCALFFFFWLELAFEIYSFCYYVAMHSTILRTLRPYVWWKRSSVTLVTTSIWSRNLLWKRPFLLSNTQ